MGIEPPQIAVWMMDHLIAGGCPEELAGDLFEQFNLRRSRGWFWSQVLSACLFSWAIALWRRAPLILFATVWSILAPAWQLLCDHVATDQAVASLVSWFGGFWIVPALLGWTLLHVTFVWLGATIYSAAHSTFAAPLDFSRFKRGLLSAPVVLDVTYGLTLVVTALYYYSIPGLSAQHLASSAAGRVTDFRLLPDLIRTPYFVALLAALWNSIPHGVKSRAHVYVQENHSLDGEEACGGTAAITRHQVSDKAFVLLLATCGTMNAVLAGFLLCSLPNEPGGGVMNVLLRGAIFVMAGVLGGIMGTWLYWKSPWSIYRRRSSFSMPDFVLVCASSWAWAPAGAILFEQLSPAMPVATAIAVFLLIFGLRKPGQVFVSKMEEGVTFPVQRELFEDFPYRTAGELYGMAVAVSLYAGTLAIALRSHWLAALLFSICSGVLTLKWPMAQADDMEPRRQRVRKLALQTACATLAAVLVTAWALLDVQHRRDGAQALHTGASSLRKSNTSKPASSPSNSMEGYESIVLWPTPQGTKTISAPVLHRALMSANGESLTLRFTGFYTYVQSSRQTVGAHPHQTFGTPLLHRFASQNALPVKMYAHQILAQPLRTDICGRVDVDVESLDDSDEPVVIRVLLRGVAGKTVRSLDLGQRRIAFTNTPSSTTEAAPRRGHAGFAISAATILKNFNEIEIAFLVGPKHARVAPKIAVENLILSPR